MTIGRLAGVPLQGTVPASGAVFRLHQTPRSLPRPLEPVEIDGWTTRLAEDRNFVVVSGGDESHIECVRAEALIRANIALDYLSATGVVDVAISDADDQTIVWAVDGSEVTMRVITTNSISLPSILVAASVTDADGEVVPPPLPPTPVVVDSMRFLRMSRTTEVLFDAYRYAFLALESLLHEVHPQTRGGEGIWLQDALRAADPLVPVARLAPPGEAAPVSWFYTNVYQDLRSGLMHAKRNYHLPGDEARRTEIARSLGSVTSYYLDLLREVHGVESGGGQWADSVWSLLSEGVLAQLRPAVSTNTVPISISDDRTFTPGGGGIIELPMSGGVQKPAPELSYILGSIDGEAVRAVGPLGRIGAIMGADTPGAYSDMPFGLEVGTAVTRFEVLVGMRNARPGRVRTHFTM
ncbi:hypothetical protein [Mycobacterium kyogaense]|uniref:hypothetical protein n=1 Tax=Mycobacterium kyogaense TaxID=2212479 RepID=UPI000DAC8388|nr:hypothetical protein [Mycobacterium kyogaense]